LKTVKKFLSLLTSDKTTYIFSYTYNHRTSPVKTLKIFKTVLYRCINGHKHFDSINTLTHLRQYSQMYTICIQINTHFYHYYYVFVMNNLKFDKLKKNPFRLLWTRHLVSRCIGTLHEPWFFKRQAPVSFLST